MTLFPLSELEEAAKRVHAVLAPTPQFEWPLLSKRLGTETWVKHENHLPVGAFKVRGGLLYLRDLAERGVKHVVAATRGNHGQSVAFAARRHGLTATIVVPQGNSVTKNQAMQALGATLVVKGHDFQAALEHARGLAEGIGTEFVPSFSMNFVPGVASYALELFAAAGDLDVVFVPVGLGSGICGLIAARDALDLRTEIVGVVATRAATYALSFAAGRPVSTPTADTLADGIACRVPDAAALTVIRRGAARFVEVDDEEILLAMRHLFTDTHNVAEGAGAAALAGAFREREKLRGKRIGLILSGGNVDPDLFARALRADEATAGR
jgi:threonine dehydratase